MKTADQFLAEAAETFKAKNKTYGDNYKNVGAAMVGMFPHGLTLKTADDWNRLHIFLLGVVKQTRYANNWDAGGHADSTHDNTVYSAMLESIDEEIKTRVIAGMGLGNGDGTVYNLFEEKGEVCAIIELCAGCQTPMTCGQQQKCLKIVNFDAPFTACEGCYNKEICSDRGYCYTGESTKVV